jgi:hypothetical protein
MNPGKGGVISPLAERGMLALYLGQEEERRKRLVALVV